MIYKQRSAPKKLIGQQALLRRLQPNYPEIQTILEQFKRTDSGFSGECDFDKQMTEYIPRYPHAILHDVCLKQDGVYFQMDSILITPSSIIIFEVKNYGGKIIVKSNPTQFIIEYPTGERKVMRNPITELDRKKYFLHEWLKQLNISIPISGIVALAFTNELIIEEPPETKILFTYEIPLYLGKLQIQQEILSNSKIRNVAFEMKKQHQEYNPFPMTQTLNIHRASILPGVICQACKFRGMQWERKKWRCPKCGNAGAGSHLEALLDWHYLIDNKITNQEFRSFANLQDRHVAKRLLRKSQLPLIGAKRTSYYVLNTLREP